MYVEGNPKSKKLLKEMVANGRKLGIFQPNDMFGRGMPQNGEFSVEGPHYPKPHSWYARVTLADGIIVKVK